MEHHHTWKSTTIQFYAGDRFSQLIRQSIIPAVLVSLCCYNDDQKELRRRYLPYRLQSINKESQQRDSWKEPSGRYWSRDHGGLLLLTCSLVCSVTFLIYPRPTDLGMELPHVAWPFHINSPQTLPWDNLVEAISSRGSYFQMGQVNKPNFLKKKSS